MEGVWATIFICHLIFGGHLLNIPKKRVYLQRYILFLKCISPGNELFEHSFNFLNKFVFAGSTHDFVNHFAIL